MRIVAGFVVAIGSVVAFSQSFNLDLDASAAPPEAGGGVPSPDFGGAANQLGTWSLVDAGGYAGRPEALVGLDGRSTGATVTAVGGYGFYGGSGYTGNTGDFCLLLNDYAVCLGPNEEIDWHFDGFAPGEYLIYTYAVRAGPPWDYDAQVTVPGSNEGAQIVSGPMPGNAFILGVTHSIHHLTLTGTSFEIDVTGPGWPYAQVNGFQIVAVPEPGTALLSFPCLLLLLRRRLYAAASVQG